MEVGNRTGEPVSFGLSASIWLREPMLTGSGPERRKYHRGVGVWLATRDCAGEEASGYIGLSTDSECGDSVAGVRQVIPFQEQQAVPFFHELRIPEGSRVYTRFES
ncbi:hypothetical protein Rs2_02702 [Raphanus sativus]|nr:hypothetical protein Rs2_02702 [Raphanus sativus]